MLWRRVSVIMAGVVLLSMVATGHGQRVVFSDDLSSFPTGWTLGSNGGHQDSWTQKANRFYSSAFSVKCTKGDSYPDSTNCWMQRNVSLVGYPMGLISFWAWQRSEGGYDFLHFEYSTDNGTSWNDLWSRSGSYASWRRVVISDIPSAANRIRFRFESDPSGHTEGVYLDDIVLYGIDTTGTTVFYDDMTDFPGRWQLRSTNNHFWGREAYRYHSPGYAMQCAGRDSGYFNNMDSRATRVINLRGSGYNSLSFWLYHSIEPDNDWLDVEYETFGGGSWIRLLHDSAPELQWHHYNFELPGDADSIRFRFRSDISDSLQGSYVDDVLVSDFGARAIDIMAAGIVSPPQDVDSGASVPVSVTVRNNGAVKVSVPVYFRIDDGSSYRAMAMVDSIAPGATATVNFPNWAANVRPGVYPVKCSTAMFIDAVPGNDALADSVTVANSDIGVVSIVRPVGLVPIGTVNPQAVVRNHGNSRTAADVTFMIPLASYVQTVQLPAGLPVRVDTMIDFPSWAAARGYYVATCSTHMVGDRIKGDNVISVSFAVGDTGWVAVAPVPAGAKGKGVKDGGCLVFAQVLDTGFVYALKGNNRFEFYRYSGVANTWVAKESVPAYGSSGRKKAVKKGACMAQMNGVIYAAKGNSTYEWWAYTPGSTSYPWRQLADVPSGAKAVREGAGAVPVRIGANDYIYFLKGSGTWEFYRYSILTNTWEALPSAPAGLSGKSYKNGSSIIYDSTAGIVYALKAGYNEFFAFNVATGTWMDRAAFPLISSSGKKKKVKDGSGMAWTDGFIYALKGGNTREFWFYQTTTDHWSESSLYPLGAGKSVKGGGAIVYASDVNALFATKGNNTLEFSKYQLSTDANDEVRKANALVGPAVRPVTAALRVSPNPFAGMTTISYRLPGAGNMSLRLYDVTGKMVILLAAGYRGAGAGRVSFAPASLAAGIYLLKLEGDNYARTQKLIVE